MGRELLEAENYWRLRILEAENYWRWRIIGGEKLLEAEGELLEVENYWRRRIIVSNRWPFKNDFLFNINTEFIILSQLLDMGLVA